MMDDKSGDDDTGEVRCSAVMRINCNFVTWLDELAMNVV